MMSQEGSTKKCKFNDFQGMDSCARAWPNESYSENALFLYSLQIQSIVMMTNEEFTKIANFMTQGLGFLFWGVVM